jgi:hypothetical protein
MCDPPSAPPFGRDSEALMDAIRVDSAAAMSLADQLRLDRLMTPAPHPVTADPALPDTPSKALPSSTGLPLNPITQNIKENRHV